MKIRTLWLFTAALLSTQAEATVQRVMQTGVEANSVPKVAVTGSSSFWSATVVSDQDELPGIKLTKHTRGSGSQFNRSSVLVSVNESNYSLLAGFTDFSVQSLSKRHSDGVVLMFSATQCDADSCDSARHFVMATDSEGQPVSEGIGQSLTQVPATNCDSSFPPALDWQPDGYVYVDNCARRYGIDTQDSQLSDGQAAPFDITDGAVINGVQQDHWQTVSEQDGSVSNLGWTAVSYELNGQDTLRLSYQSSSEQSSWQWQQHWTAGAMPQCDVSGRSSVLVRCLASDGTVTYWQMNADGEVVGEGSWPSDTTSSWRQASSIFIDDHVYTAAVSEETGHSVNTNSAGQLFSQYELELTLFPADELIPASPARFDREEQGLFVVRGALQGQQAAFLLYDFLPQDLQPRFLANGSGTVASDTDYEFELRFVDEETLQQDITVTVSGQPGWLEFDAQTNRFSGRPYHDEVGKYEFATQIEAGEQSASLTTEVSVVLTPWQLNFYEEALFEQLELDEAVSLEALVNSLGAIPVEEDTSFSATLSRVNRAGDELTVTVTNLPAWLSFDADTLVLSGQPAQMDVGSYPDITVEVTDAFAEDDETETLALPMEVVEVDEVFTVTSTPNTAIMVGQSYQYQLTIEDEESDISELTITPGAMPEWLSYNGDNQKITGTVPANAVGDHLVQLEVRDPGGNRVLHSFTITVTDDPDSDSGGGSMLWLLPLAALALYRRRYRA